MGSIIEHGRDRLMCQVTFSKLKEVGVLKIITLPLNMKVMASSFGVKAVQTAGFTPAG